LIIAGVLLLGVHLALSRVIDPDTVSPERPILSLIADDLPFDTVFWRSTDYPLPAGGVRIAPLAGFTPNQRDWGSYVDLTWGAAFKDSAIGFIAAVPSAIGKAEASCIEDVAQLGNDVCEFVQKWVSSPPDRRVFIAFTKDDVEHANNVARSLEKAGYAVFIFLKGKDQKPWADPGMVGEVFKQAQFRLVLDSANARGSPGVALEKHCCDVLLLPRPPITPIMRALQGNS
jgi:hypothetical protein